MKSPAYERPTDPARSDLMRRVRQRGTAAELNVAAVLREMGLHYRKNAKALPGSPDFANRTRKWAIFVNGCFWHHHDGCVRATIPTRNRPFWLDKFSANQLRDRKKKLALTRMGFKVVVIWECEATNAARVRRRVAPLCLR